MSAQRCLFASCHSSSHGGALVFGSSGTATITIDDCSFVSCYAISTSYLNGGAIVAEQFGESGKVTITRTCGNGCWTGYGQLAAISSYGPVGITDCTSYECAPSDADSALTGVWHFLGFGTVTTINSNVSNSRVVDRGGCVAYWDWPITRTCTWNYGTFSANNGKTLIGSYEWDELLFQNCLLISNVCSGGFFYIYGGTVYFFCVQCLFKGHGSTGAVSVRSGEGYVYAINCQFDGALPSGMIDTYGNIVQKSWRYSVTRTNSQTRLNCAFLKTVPTNAFTASEKLTATSAMSETNHFSKSSAFTQSSGFTQTKGFSKSSTFRQSSGFTQTKGLSKSSAFWESSKMGQSSSFLRSWSFSETDILSGSVHFSDSSELPKTISFSKSEGLSNSISFTPSGNFTTSATISLSEELYESTLITESEELLETVSFIGSISFSDTTSFTKGDVVLESSVLSFSVSFSEGIFFESISDLISPPEFTVSSHSSLPNSIPSHQTEISKFHHSSEIQIHSPNSVKVSLDSDLSNVESNSFPLSLNTVNSRSKSVSLLSHSIPSFVENVLSSPVSSSVENVLSHSKDTGAVSILSISTIILPNDISFGSSVIETIASETLSTARFTSTSAILSNSLTDTVDSAIVYVGSSNVSSVTREARKVTKVSGDWILGYWIAIAVALTMDIAGFARLLYVEVGLLENEKRKKKNTLEKNSFKSNNN
jgi:hypothetical protein